MLLVVGLSAALALSAASDLAACGLSAGTQEVQPAVHSGVLRSGPGRDGALAGPDNKALVVDAPLLSPAVVDAGQRMNLSVAVTGGYPPYNVTWLGLPPGCPNENKTKYHCFPGAPSGLSTPFEVSVRVVDTMANNVTSNATPGTVNPDPTVAVELSPASAGVPPFFVNFTAVPDGGTAPFQYSWIFGDGGSGVGVTVPHEYTTLGTFEVTVWGNDSLGQTAIGYAKVRSVALPSIVVSAEPFSTVRQGAAVSFTVEPAGGLGPFTYEWSGLPSFCALPTLPNATTVACSESVAGTYTVSVLATDSLQHTSRGTVTLTVTAPTTTWEYVAVGFLGIAVVLAIILAVQVVRYRQARRRPPPLGPAGDNPIP